MEMRAVAGLVPVGAVMCQTHDEEQFVFFTKAWGDAWLEQKIGSFTLSFTVSPSPVFPTWKLREDAGRDIASFCEVFSICWSKV